MRWNAESYTATPGTPGIARDADSITARSVGMCSGASGTSGCKSAISFGVTRSGPPRSPPWTTR